MRIQDKRRGRATIAVTYAIAAAVAVVVSGCSGGGSDGSEGAESIVTPSASPTPSEANPVRPPQIGGAPPGTPYWHNRVLHVGDYEIKTRYRPVEVAVDTVLVGRNIGRHRDTPWALLRNHKLTPITAGSNTYPQLSFDGRIAYWSWRNSPQTTRYVVWDTETNRELASRDFEGHDAGLNGGPRLYIAGIDANGIAYVVDERSDVDVTRWDVRADTEEPVPGLTAADMTYANGYGELRQDQFVSPDGTKEVFTSRAPGDSPPDCCATLLRVRPVGSDDLSDLVRLRLPEGVPTSPSGTRFRTRAP